MKRRGLLTSLDFTPRKLAFSSAPAGPRKAIAACAALLHNQPRFIVAVRAKIVALAYLGRLGAVRAELERLLALYPGLTIAAFRPTTASFDPEFIEFALAGLRLAGRLE